MCVAELKKRAVEEGFTGARARLRGKRLGVVRVDAGGRRETWKEGGKWVEGEIWGEGWEEY